MMARQRQVSANDVEKVFYHIWKGGMPQLLGADDELRMEYYNSYVDTYLMRDVAVEGGITDTVRFTKFLKACAALVSEQVNYATLAESSDISQPTAKANVTYYRDSNAKEIDLLIVENQIIHPLEVKKSAYFFLFERHR